MNYAKIVLLLTIAIGSYSNALQAMQQASKRITAANTSDINSFKFATCCPEEKILLEKRLPRMQEAISNFIHTSAMSQKVEDSAPFPREEDTQKAFTDLIPYNRLPNIGVTVSGGGWVAAIAELGLLKGLRDIGLLDGVASIATSSGSTWMLSTWLNLSRVLDERTSLDDVEKYLRERLEEGFTFDKKTLKDWKETFMSRHAMGLPFDITCLWGEALTRQFLDIGSDCSVEHSLSNVSELTLSGLFPLPLFTSIIKPEVSWGSWAKSFIKKPADVPNTYLEYSPFITRLNGKATPWVSTSKIGVTWNYLLGTWGSAYAGTFKDNGKLLHEALQDANGWRSNLANACTNCCTVTNPLSPTIPNFLKDTDTPFKDDKMLRPIDSGIELKIPFPPLFDRNTQIIIACDVSSDSEYTNGMHSLQQTARYAQMHGICFPKINTETVLTDDKVDFIIDRDNPGAPIVIYFKGAPAEMKPHNTPKEFSDIHNDMYLKVVTAKDTIVAAIAAHLERTSV